MATYDFTGTGALDGNWTATSGSAPERSSDVGISASGTRLAHYSGAAFDDDQFSEAEVTVTASGFNNNGVTVRASVTNGGTFYRLRINGSSGDVSISERSSFSEGTLASSAGGLIATSGFPFTHTLRLEVEGTALRGYLDTVLVVSTTDASIASGAPGIMVTASAATIDNWEGADLAAAGGTNISATLATGTGAAQAPSVRTSPKISPANVSRTGAVQAPTVLAGVRISPATVTRTGSAQAPSMRTSPKISPANVSRTGTAGTPTIQSVGGGVTTVTASTAYGYGTAGSPTLTGVDPPGVLWRIGGYPVPSHISRSTGARALSNR